MGNHSTTTKTNSTLQNQPVDNKTKPNNALIRPLPQADQNELHCIIQPIYPVAPGQTIVSQKPIQPTTSNVGYANSEIAPQGSGMVRQEGYVQKTTTIKETIKLPTVM